MNTLHIVAGIIDTSGLPRTSAGGNNTINVVLNIVFGLAASISVLMMVIGGFRYIVAHGDPSQTAAAKNGIQYAVIGLVVVMAAYSIVTFVVGKL